MTFYFNLESLVLPDSQVHPFYTPSSRPIFDEVRRGSARFGDVIRCSAMLSELQFTIVTDSGGEFKLDMKYIQAAIPNWSGDLDTRHSTIGDGGTVAWKSRRQPTVAPVYYRGKVRGIRRLTPSWTTSHHKSSK